jgi:hypothetical protein
MTADQFGGVVTPPLNAPPPGVVVPGLQPGTSPAIVRANIVIIFGTNDGLFIYNGTPALGNLIGSWTGQSGTDAFGNPYPAGINVTQGQLSGVGITNAQIVQAILESSVLDNSSITNSAMSGGTITETVVTFDTSGGYLIAYANTTTTVTDSTAGPGQFTVPTGVTTLDVTCTGAGAGGNGGTSSAGGHGGGGGETARESQYTVTPGTVIDYVVGTGGANSATGSGDGDDGTQTIFDLANQGVVANPGLGDGTKGTGSTATIHHDGGAGGTASSTGGAGGGGSGGKTGAGGNGGNSSSSSGGSAGSAGSGGGAAGGAGGASGANGNNGSSPGAGGGGAGKGTSVTNFSKTYTCTATHTYQGDDAGSSLINSNGTSYQGGNVSDTFNGRAKTWIVFDHATIASDLASVTLSSTKLRLNNNHTWYNSGMTVCVGWDTVTSFGSSRSNPSGGNIDSQEYHVDEGATTTTAISGLGTAFKNGTAYNVVLFKNSGSLTYYGYFAGKNQSSPPQLTFTGTIGAGATNSGNGSDGQVVITYTTGAAVLASFSPVAFTDSFSNAIPAGIMVGAVNAPVVALDPVAKNTAETWHSLGTLAGASLTQAAYRMTPEGELELDFHGSTAGSNAQAVTFSVNLPAAYRPTTNNRRQPIHTGRAVTAGETFPYVQVTTGGAVQVNFNAASISVTFDVNCRIRLDGSP